MRTRVLAPRTEGMGQPLDDKQLRVSTRTVVSLMNVDPPNLRNPPSTPHPRQGLPAQPAQLAFSL
eukprot:2321210-Pyramimonas_sp.AAC.1